MKENLINEEYRPTVLEPIGEDPEEKDEWQKKSCCGKCCHYLFCCCCCTNYEKSKNSYRKGWRKYLTREGNDSSYKKVINLISKINRG